MKVAALVLGIASILFGILVFLYSVMTFEIVILGVLVINPYVLFIKETVQDEGLAVFLAWILPVILGILLFIISVKSKR